MPRQPKTRSRARPSARQPRSKRATRAREHVSDVQYPLLSLPRELRDNIYHFLWMDTPHLMVTYGRLRYSVYYNMTPIMITDRAPIPAVETFISDKVPWLLASKQIYEEGLIQFQREACWISAGEKTSGSLRPSILNPSGGRTLELKSAFTGRLEWKTDFDGAGPPTLEIVIPPKLETHFVELGECSNRLQEIFVTLGIAAQSFDCSENDIKFDLSPLTYLGINAQNLKQFDIALAICYNRRRDEIQPWEYLEYPFFEEVCRIGEAIMDDGFRCRDRVVTEPLILYDPEHKDPGFRTIINHRLDYGRDE